MKSCCFISLVKEFDIDWGGFGDQYVVGPVPALLERDANTYKETSYGDRVGEADSEKVQRDFWRGAVLIRNGKFEEQSRLKILRSRNRVRGYNSLLL